MPDDHSDDTPSEDSAYRIAEIELDQDTLRPTSSESESERRIAIFDLLHRNFFRVLDGPGPYKVRLAVIEQRLSIECTAITGGPERIIMLSLGSLRALIKDYFLTCESYHQAIRAATPEQIEALDMGRRALHNEGANILRERLEGKAQLDHETARRLFTLVCALQPGLRQISL